MKDDDGDFGMDMMVDDQLDLGVDISDTPLTWGLSKDKSQAVVSKYGVPFNAGSNYLMIGSMILRNFPCDCGSLIITSANEADKRSLEAIVEVASRGGFDKIFATVVLEHFEHAAKVFKKCGFNQLSKAPSNRNPEKTALTFFRFIEEPLHKGY